MPHLVEISHMSISHLVRLDICGKESDDSSPDVPSLCRCGPFYGLAATIINNTFTSYALTHNNSAFIRARLSCRSSFQSTILVN